jgi:hypothetical protein
MFLRRTENDKNFERAIRKSYSLRNDQEKRPGEAGVEELLVETIAAAKRLGAIKASGVKRVIVDTTVMEKPREIQLQAGPETVDEIFRRLGLNIRLPLK